MRKTLLIIILLLSSGWLFKDEIKEIYSSFSQYGNINQLSKEVPEKFELDVTNIFESEDHDSYVNSNNPLSPISSAKLISGSINPLDNLREVFIPEKVILYSTSWCPYCKKARQFLKENKIKYHEYDIETSTPGLSRYLKLQGKGVPVIEFGSTVIHGYNTQQYEKAAKRL